MTYNDWYETHSKKHAAIMKKLEGLDEFDVVQYFIFENMVEKEPNFMPLIPNAMICMSLTAICVVVLTLDTINRPLCKMI